MVSLKKKKTFRQIHWLTLSIRRWYLNAESALGVLYNWLVDRNSKPIIHSDLWHFNIKDTATAPDVTARRSTKRRNVALLMGTSPRRLSGTYRPLHELTIHCISIRVWNKARPEENDKYSINQFPFSAMLSQISKKPQVGNLGLIGLNTLFRTLNSFSILLVILV